MINNIKKTQRGKIKGNFNLKFLKLYWGIISLTSGYLTNKQFETSKFIINKYIKKIGYYNIYIQCIKSMTKKSLKTRMGAGKGPIELYVCKIKKGKLLFEISEVSVDIIYKITKILSYKLNLKLQYIKKIIN
ncbi:apicoplast ribosomal protein L16 (apicoplast) [Plasmodium yoelii]|uniref:Apicoplast ribosomal protein L16 n=2 Tax=Plasmodium yoelii TaxID=5861 RepID=A0AAF0B804_PLAYO|nr:apicoplast ribosomal protein L16 [Plasmodium yoelii]WBY61411.1 apicoplast ribosomal protein L16 [Plasmodium yoelii yoelii]BAL70685.1 large subunit ribosomal protein 16 [Plasmodium yoelii]CDU21044.1 apicoplast ribosomal protein L16 [Plasmodium yoelii]VTZ82065.1 apicoplast ribosomal protein L16 [Plasmodium yoelii]|eukprot:XP_022811197.1 apicoplast ribosomal protein L16 (apicoplast) [Plasmodium yoelii]